jgi:hypothetical protein
MESEIQSWIRSILSTVKSCEEVFPILLDKFRIHFSKSCGSIQQLQRRNTKQKGDLFERFCLLYLKKVEKYEGWLLSDAPDEILKELGLDRKDNGIDAIIRSSPYSLPSAVQMKYRKRSEKRNKYLPLTWKMFSTFDSLCSRTGKLDVETGKRQWQRLIVMTNCDFVGRKGRKSEQDRTIGYKKFCSLSRAVWLQMIDSFGCKLSSESKKEGPVEEVPVEEKKESPVEEKKEGKRDSKKESPIEEKKEGKRDSKKESPVEEKKEEILNSSMTLAELRSSSAFQQLDVKGKWKLTKVQLCQELKLTPSDSKADKKPKPEKESKPEKRKVTVKKPSMEELRKLRSSYYEKKLEENKS